MLRTNLRYRFLVIGVIVLSVVLTIIYGGIPKKMIGIDEGKVTSNISRFSKAGPVPKETSKEILVAFLEDNGISGHYAEIVALYAIMSGEEYMPYQEFYIITNTASLIEFHVNISKSVYVSIDKETNELRMFMKAGGGY